MLHTFSIGIEQVKLCPCMINQALPITCEIARIKILVLGVAAYIFSKRRTGIDIADSFMVGKEVDTLTNPAGSGNISIELQQTPERSVILEVAPQMPNGAPPVAFPISPFPHVATQDDSTSRPI